jgi:adenine-specific DNA methylase
VTSESTGSFIDVVEIVAGCVNEATKGFLKPGQAEQADACAAPLVDDAAGVWFTDPPYYDAVPYADLSDFFFVWLKRVLPGQPVLRDPFDAGNPLTPKEREAVQDETKTANGQPKDRRFCETTMTRTFTEGRRVLRDDGVGCVLFAHKTTEGWEALLSGMMQGGWVITASWPIVTEMSARLRAGICCAVGQCPPGLPASGRERTRGRLGRCPRGAARPGRRMD